MKKLPIMAMASVAMAGMAVAQEAPTIPDRVSLNPDSPWFWPGYTRLGLMLDGAEQRGDVHEFCVSEGWIVRRCRNRMGQFMIENGEFKLEQLFGEVSPYVKSRPEPRATDSGEQARLAAAQAKRDRKAAKRRAQS